MTNMQSEHRISYDQIRTSVPNGLKKPQREKRKLRAWQVLIYFVIVMLIFILIGGPIQGALGLWGVAITELGFLVFAILFALLMRTDLREVFPIKKPRLLGLVGVLVAWIGVYLTSYAYIYLVIGLFPSATISSAGSVSGFFDGQTVILIILIAAVLPAICEEAMHRGVIQSGLKNSFRNKWVVILGVGIIFGLFHMDPIRIPVTGFVGGVAAYMLWTTNNMCYSSFLHLIHNGITFVITLSAGAAVSGEATERAFEMIERYAGVVSGTGIMMFGAPAPILIYVGCYLLRRATAPVKPKFLPKGKEKSTLLWILVPTGSMIVLGMLLIFRSVLQSI